MYMLIELGRPWVLTLHLTWGGGGEPVDCSYVAYTLHTLSTIMTFGLKHSGQSVWPEIHFENPPTRTHANRN